MAPKGNCAIKHHGHTLLVANVSIDPLYNCGIICYRTDMLRKCSTRCTVSSFIHSKKQLKFTVFASIIFGNVKPNNTFLVPRTEFSSMKFACL